MLLIIFTVSKECIYLGTDSVFISFFFFFSVFISNVILKLFQNKT